MKQPGPNRRLLTLGAQFTRLTGWFAAGDQPPGLSDVARMDLHQHVLKIIAKAVPLPAKTPKERLVKAAMLRWLIVGDDVSGLVGKLALSLCADLGAGT